MVVSVRYLAWLIVAIVVFATLSPIELRPHFWSPNAERFVAFLLMGAAMTFAYPRHLSIVIVSVLGSAMLLELLQLLVPTRDASAHDAAIKVAGGLIGIVIGKLGVMIFNRRARSGSPLR